MRQNLYQLALANEESLCNQFLALLEAHKDHPHAEKLQCLHDECEAEWSISINLRDYGVDFFLDNGTTYNSYKARSAEGKTVFKPSPDPAFSPVDWPNYVKLLDSWGPQRRAFNEFADQEENFTYGAYFIQGEGLSMYGKYLIKLKVDALKQSNTLTFLMADSLQKYTTVPKSKGESSILNTSLLKAEIATANTVTKLMCYKKDAELQGISVAECKDRICWCESDKNDSPSEYIEAHIAQEIGFDEVEAFYSKKLNQEESDHYALLFSAKDVGNPDNFAPQAEKNAYYYLKFRREFSKKGIPVMNFA